MDKQLAAALKRDDEREAAGMHADDRETCYTHQCWATECEGKHLQVTAGRPRGGNGDRPHPLQQPQQVEEKHMPTVHGLELHPGDDLGTDTAPDCCDEEMAAKDTADGYRNYTCGECDTVLVVLPVAANGIVFDIRP